MINNDKEFNIKIDVQHFKPDEIAVKTVDNHVVISADHEEKEDEHGYICRSFTRRYVLPKVILKCLNWAAAFLGKKSPNKTRKNNNNNKI